MALLFLQPIGGCRTPLLLLLKKDLWIKIYIFITLFKQKVLPTKTQLAYLLKTYLMGILFIYTMEAVLIMAVEMVMVEHEEGAEVRFFNGK